MTDKERLEEIKLKFNNTIDAMLYVPYEDVKFLIKQAERVEELESEIENWQKGRFLAVSTFVKEIDLKNECRSLRN